MKVADWLPDVGPEDGAQSEAGCWGDAKRLALRLRHARLGRMALDLALEWLLVFTVLKVGAESLCTACATSSNTDLAPALLRCAVVVSC